MNQEKTIKQSKKKVYIITISIILAVLIAGVITIKKCPIMSVDLKYSQEYVNGEPNIKGDVNVEGYKNIHIDFDIGANKYGTAVFKDPNKALKRLKKDYSKGLKLIQNEYNLLPLNSFNFKTYETYGWQVTTGSDEERAQALFVTSFMDIYDNSFN